MHFFLFYEHVSLSEHLPGALGVRMGQLAALGRQSHQSGALPNGHKVLSPWSHQPDNAG